MEIDPKDLLFPLIGLLGLLTPICVLFWKVAQVVFNIKKNEDDIAGVGAKLNNYIIDQEKRFSELSSQIARMSEMLTRMDVRMSTMVEALQEVKLDIKNNGMRKE